MSSSSYPQRDNSNTGNNSSGASSNSHGGAGSSKVLLSSGIRGEGTWPSFLFSVRRLMSPYRESQKEYSLDCFSQFSRFILLHGLLSICWDSQWRGLLDMGIVSKRRMSEFRLRLVQAIASWREYFDRQLKELNTPDFNLLLSANGEQSYRRRHHHVETSTAIAARHRNLSQNNAVHSSSTDRRSSMTPHLNYYGNSPLLCANWSLYNFGLIALYSDTSSLRTFAEGLSSIGISGSDDPAAAQSSSSMSSSVSSVLASAGNYLGGTQAKDAAAQMSLARQRAVARSLEQLKAQKVVYSWAASEDARWAVWHSAHFLVKVFSNEAMMSQADHMPWCVYIATLSLWAYEVSRAAQSHDELESSRYILNIEQVRQHKGESQSQRQQSQRRRQSAAESPRGGGADESGAAYRRCPFQIDAARAKADALDYVGMVQRFPPKSMQTTPTASEDQHAEAQMGPSPGDAVERRESLVMGLVAHVYGLFSKYDRGLNQNAVPLMYSLLDRYNTAAR